MISVRTSTGLQPLKGIQVRDASGTLRNIASVSVRDAGGLRTMTFAPKASVQPASVRGTGNSANQIRVTTAPATASGGGTYAWSISDPTWNVDYPTSASTTFTSPILGPGEAATATATCVITDAGGNSASAPCAVSARNAYISRE